MPGVKIATLPRGGAGSVLRAPSGTWFVAGVTERGDITKAVELRGMSDYAIKLGDQVPYSTLYDQLKTFFDEGGARAYVARVVGPAATLGTRTLVDRAGSPIATLRVDAASVGGWSSRLTIEVQDGTETDTFRILIRQDASVVEDRDNLTSPADAVSAFGESPYVRLTDLVSSTIAPNNNPAVLGAVALTTDGIDDRASITDTIRITALGLFTRDLGDGAVSIPAAASTAVYDGIKSHCVATNRIGILSADRAASSSTLISTSIGYARQLGAEYLGLFAPWVLVDDGAGGMKAIGPEGFVAAMRNRAHEQEGPWRLPAGEIAEATAILGVDTVFDDDTADNLDAARVSVIRAIGGVPTLYGWRSLSADEVDYYWLKNRDLLNRLTIQGAEVLQRELFKNVDGRGHLLSAIASDLIGLLEPVRQAGGLYENVADDGQTVIDPGYSVDTGPDVNPAASLATQSVSAVMLVRPTPAASLIKLTITEVGLTAAV